MCPAVPTMTLFVGVDMDAGARNFAPSWMLLEERIGGQTAEATSRQRFRRRWLARRRADRARSEWAGQPPENRRPREWLPSASRCAPDRRVWIRRIFPRAALPE